MKLIRNLFLINAVVALALASCNSNTKKESSGDLTLLPLTNDPSAEKQQLYLRLVNNVETDSSILYTAKSLHNSDTVGLKIEILKNIKPGLDKEGKVDQVNGFRKGSIKLSSIGSQSDYLLKSLSSIFGIETSAEMTKNIIEPTVFSSNQYPIDLSKSTTFSFKLFFENEDGQVAEIFAVLDTFKKSFELAEKDSSFRQDILNALEAK